MHKNKLMIVLVIPLAVMIAVMVGCAGKKQPSAEKPAPSTERKQEPAPTPKVQEPPKRVEEKQTVPSDIRFDTVYFDFDKSNIRSDQRSTMNRNAQLLDQYKTIRIQIEGHCDERGTNEYNLALGERRAESVKQYLVDYGISSSRITTISYGEERPVDSRHNESAWAKNRRSEFVITAK